MQSSRLIALLNQQRAVVYVGLATFLFTLGQGIAVLTAVPLYGDAIGLTSTHIGFAVFAFALARVLTNVPSAMVSDRIGRRWILIAGALIAATGNVLSAFAGSLVTFIIFRFIAGIGSSAFITVGIATTVDLSTPANRARLLSVFQWSFIAGITLGPLVGGFVAQFLGVRVPFYVVGLVAVMSALWTMRMVPETRGRQVAQSSVNQPQAASSPRLNRYAFMLSRGYLLVMLIFIAAFFVRGGGYFTLFPLIAKNDLGLTEGFVGIMQTLPAIASLVILPFVGAISDRYGRKSVIVPGMALYLTCLVILGYSASAILISAAVVFAIGIFVFGIAQGMEGPVPIAYVADVSPTDSQATAQGMARTIGDVALMVGGPLLGFVSDTWGSTEALYGTAIVVGVFMLIFWVFARETAGRRAQQANSS